MSQGVLDCQGQPAKAAFTTGGAMEMTFHVQLPLRLHSIS
jgi:hypothetical protein